MSGSKAADAADSDVSIALTHPQVGTMRSNIVTLWISQVEIVPARRPRQGQRQSNILFEHGFEHSSQVAGRAQI